MYALDILPPFRSDLSLWELVEKGSSICRNGGGCRQEEGERGAWCCVLAVFSEILYDVWGVFAKGG